MSSSTRSPQPTPVPGSGAAGLRLSVNDGPHDGPLDGAWWPRSRDLRTEVADLVDHFPTTTGTVARLLFTRPDGEGQTPRHSDHKVPCAHGVVDVGSFPHHDTHRVVLVLDSHARMTLLVIPPDTPTWTAQHLMGRAADPLNQQGAAELLSGLGLRLDPDPLEVWDSAGGAC